MNFAVISTCHSSAAFTPATHCKTSTSLNAITASSHPAAIAPMGSFHLLDCAKMLTRKSKPLLRSQGDSWMCSCVHCPQILSQRGCQMQILFLLDSQISGPAITHFTQVPYG